MTSLEDDFNNFIGRNWYVQKRYDRERELLDLFSLEIEEGIIPNKHKFTVIIEFESGRSFELETDEIVLK